MAWQDIVYRMIELIAPLLHFHDLVIVHVDLTITRLAKGLPVGLPMTRIYL